MPLAVVVGSSGSGKTTFLNDVHRSHKCVYIRQYHAMRPYITVKSIPQFDPTKLPYWDIYEKEGKADKIQVGGTISGKFTAGLSGGQRKMLMFEIICQRLQQANDNVLVVLDEPFAGVTDDFVPFLITRLETMRQRHNVLLVTNDHVEALTGLADHTIRVSAVDRTKVTITINHSDVVRIVDREKIIAALAVGEPYRCKTSGEDLGFFFNVEIKNDAELLNVAVFTVVLFALYIATFWKSPDSAAPLVLIAGGLVLYFAVNPYLLSLVDWSNVMAEEAEALIHASKGMNRALKLSVCLLLVLIIMVVLFISVNIILDGPANGFHTFEFFVSMYFEVNSYLFPLMGLGLYTTLSFQLVQILGTLPFLLMIFFSTTFSPGNEGLPGLKELRYLFARFYYFCLVPSLDGLLEGCPTDGTINLILLIATSLIGTFLFVIYLIVTKFAKDRAHGMRKNLLVQLAGDEEFRMLQTELFGKKKKEQVVGNGTSV